MAKNKAHSSLQAARSPVNGYPDTPKSNVGPTASFPPSDKPACTPNFLDILSDCCDNVDFYLKCDQISHGDNLYAEKMSGKKCLFCS